MITITGTSQEREAIDAALEYSEKGASPTDAMGLAAITSKKPSKDPKQPEEADKIRKQNIQNRWRIYKVAENLEVAPDDEATKQIEIIIKKRRITDQNEIQEVVEEVDRRADVQEAVGVEVAGFHAGGIWSAQECEVEHADPIAEVDPAV